jgi:hypothetical protein
MDEGGVLFGGIDFVAGFLVVGELADECEDGRYILEKVSMIGNEVWLGVDSYRRVLRGGLWRRWKPW